MKEIAACFAIAVLLFASALRTSTEDNLMRFVLKRLHLPLRRLSRRSPRRLTFQTLN